MEFQKRLGAVYATIKRCWYDLAIFAVCFLVLSLPSAMFFIITVGPYYDKMATLGDAFYHVTLSNVAGSQVDIATEVINIMRAQGITGLSAMSLYVMIYGLPLLFGWVMLSFLLAIIGDAYTEVKAEFQNSPTLYADMHRCSLQVRHRKKSSSGRILALMKKLEETKEQKEKLRETSNYSAGLQSKKNWVHLGERTMGPEELRDHIGLLLETQFTANSFKRKAGQPDPKGDACVSDLAKYLRCADGQASEEWALFHNPLLRYHIGEMPKDGEEEPSIPVVTRRNYKGSKQRQFNRFSRLVNILVKEVTAARQLMATRWDRVYMDLYVSHYGFSEVNYSSEVDFSSSCPPSTSASTLHSSPLDKMRPIHQDEFQLDIKEDDSEEGDERRLASIPASVRRHCTDDSTQSADGL